MTHLCHTHTDKRNETTELTRVMRNLDANDPPYQVPRCSDTRIVIKDEESELHAFCLSRTQTH